MRADRVLGLLLIAIGAALFVGITTGIGGELVVAALGVGFLVAYASTRSYGFLVPGAILTGLGMGVIVAALGGPDEAVVLGLGVGFLAIAVLDVLIGEIGSAWWWPLIPGGVLTIVGTSTMVGIEDVGRYVMPVVLVLVGIALLLRRPTPSEPSEPPPGEPDRSDGPVVRR